METHLPLLTSVLLLIVGSRLLGEFCRRLGQTALVGEILSGIVLGPALLNLVQPNAQLAGISELSVFLIVLAAGLEMEFGEVMDALKGRGLFSAALDMFVPLAGGILLGVVFHLDPLHSLFLGLCMSITALPVAVRILESFRLLGTSIARYSIATAIMNDIVALLFLGIILDMAGDGLEIGMTLTKVTSAILRTGFGLVVFAFLVFLAFRLLIWGGSRTKAIEGFLSKVIELFGKEALFGVAIVFVLIFGSVSENMGSHFVIGTFFAGLLLNKDVLGREYFADLQHTLHSFTDGFLAPIFFAYLGLHFTPQTFSNPFFVFLLIAIAVASKIGAGYFGARWLSLSKLEALGIGIILNGRGIMELVVANIAFQKGFIDADAFSALVFMGVFTTVITPILFRRFVLPGLSRS